jgi:hypothetical protein
MLYVITLQLNLRKVKTLDITRVLKENSNSNYTGVGSCLVISFQWLILSFACKIFKKIFSDFLVPEGS